MIKTKLSFLIALFLILVLTVESIAQGALQFNRVKVVTSSETVPANKVWKVVSVIYNIPYDQPSFQNNTAVACSETRFRSVAIDINGIPTKVGSGSAATGTGDATYVQSYTALPFWLPEGYVVSGGPCLNMISILEFNVVP